MSAISEETVQGMTAPSLAPSSKTVVAPTELSAKPIAPRRQAGSGPGVAAAVLVALALMGALATYLGYRYYESTQTALAPATSPSPLALIPATPVPPPVVAAGTPAPVSAPSLEAVAPSPQPTAVASNAETANFEEILSQLTPAERRALMGRDPVSRRQRLAAMAAARRARLGGVAPETGSATTGVEGGTVKPTVQPPRHTRINLEVEASQPSTGTQIGALYAQVMIDNRPYRDFVIRFVGANPFARWKRVENIVLENVPLSAREITLAVATDPGLNEERMEGSTRLSLEGEETNLSVAVRFYNQFDKSVKFR
jgi:hypothetical protein